MATFYQKTLKVLAIMGIIGWTANAQNVGIGTTTPGSRLEVRGTTNDNTASVLNLTSNAGTSRFFVRNDGRVGINETSSLDRGMLTITSNLTNGIAGWNRNIYFNNTNHSSITTNGLLLGFHDTDKAFYFGDITGTTFNKHVMTIFANTGRVGINTTAPSQLFHVYTNTDMYAAAIGNDAASHLRIAGTAGGSSGYSLLQTFTNASTAGGNLILQRDAGNVGIGIASPSAQLHATGTIRSGGAGVGYSMLYPGTTSNAGYVQVHAPDGSEVGYMGWLKDRLFHYSNHNFHEFNGSVRVGGINSTYVWPGQIGLRGSNPFISWHNADAAGTRIGYMQITGTGSDAGNVIIGSGSLRATCLAGSGSRVLVADGLGTITAVPYSIVGDNLGNHTATSYLFMDYQWIRFRGSTGLYNSDFGQHFFTTNNSNYWVSRSGLGMQFLNASAATMGYVYHDGTNFGLLDAGGAWTVRTNTGVVAIHKNMQVNGNVSITGTMNSTGYKETSDARWKKNVSTISNALSKVMAMRGVNYDFKTKEELLAEKQDTTYQFSNKKQIGFIAQEVEKVLPEVVSTDEKGFKTVEYSKVVALLVEAMKEQQKEIEALKAENASLKVQAEKVQKLEAKMAKLEEMMNALQDMNNIQVKK